VADDLDDPGGVVSERDRAGRGDLGDPGGVVPEHGTVLVPAISLGPWC